MMRHSRRVVLEGVVAPFAIFYVVLLMAGIRGACIAGLGWSLFALVRRLVRRERIPATLVVGTLMLAFRTALTVATGSAFLYFAQPTAGTALLAVVVLATALVRRPILERLAHDFCPLDPALVRRAAVRRFFRQVSVLWGLVFLANSACVMWLLLTTSIRAFVVERTVLSWLVTAAAIVASVVWFVRVMRGEKVKVHFSGRIPPRVGAGATSVRLAAAAPPGSPALDLARVAQSVMVPDLP
jgi:hypothetical protein